MKLFCLTWLMLVIQSHYLVCSIAVMSVDLGNQFMKIAIVKPGVPMEIVLNKESRRKTAVAISLRSVERDFGESAMGSAVKQPKSSYFNIVELLGKSSMENPTLQTFMKRYPFYDIQQDSATKTLQFQQDSETKYTPEELVAMILEYAKELASDFAEQPVDAAVITVPAYFTQTERKALLRSAELANLNVLQLINSNTAAALNYGTFRRKDFNTTGTTIMLFDMGSSGTTVTIANYQMVKLKDDFEQNPQLSIKGVGYDRSLGGSEFTYRLVEHFAKVIQAEKKINIFDHPKSLLKLYKEAERVKIVLSANTEHKAQIESLFDNYDFRTKITREEFETICADLFLKIQKPVLDAMKQADVTLDDIESVILVGGSVRIPKVQDELTKVVKKELGKSLNNDEAMALGAVYQAAYQSKGYKVKKFYVRDLVSYPIVVDFDRSQAAGAGLDDENSSNKSLRRVLYDRNNAYPQKKTLTLNKYDTDFSFLTKYGDLSYLDERDLQNIESKDLFRINVNGVTEAFEKYKAYLSKGLRIHFNNDDSGILKVDKVDISFEELENTTAEGDESTLSKIGNKISSFFGSATESTESPVEDKEREEIVKEQVNVNQTAQNDTNTLNSTNVKTPQAPTIKPKIVKESLKFETLSLDYVEMSAEDINSIKSRLKTLKDRETEKRKRASLINTLETFIYDTKAKFYDDVEFNKCLKVTEKEEILAKLNEANEWLFDVADDSTDTKTFKEKLSELKAATKDVYFRVNEKKLRPRKLDELNEVLNASAHFLTNAKNMTSDDGSKPYTVVEVNSLEKIIDTTSGWVKTMLEEQAKLEDNEQPKLLTADIGDKTEALKREVSYLITKAKYFKPKTTAKPVKEEPVKEKSSNSSDEKKSTKEEEKKESNAENKEKTGENDDAVKQDQEKEKSKEKEPTPSPEL